jgi:tRNA/rRNA methyltransferase
MIQADTTSIVLVEPSLPENIGATARAMKNMGFRNLRLVAPRGNLAHLSHAARRNSAGSEEILEQARTFDTLAEAIFDLQVVVGCTARRGKGRHPLLEPRDLPSRLENHPPGTGLGVVFGREDRGLENPELDLCHLLLTIPTDAAHTSLNLAQAVLLVCYELGVPSRSSPSGKKPRNAYATSREMEELFLHGRRVLLEVGFLDPQNPDRILRVLRRITGRAGLDSRDVSILRGILRKMDWYANRTGPVPDPGMHGGAGPGTGLTKRGGSG